MSECLNPVSYTHLDDEEMERLAESITQHGVLMPGLVRPRAAGGYEIVAGHRRKLSLIHI